MSASPSATRRGFLVQASAGLAAGSLLPASAQTAGGSAPPAAPADLPDRLPYDEQFRRRAFEVRSALARAAAEQPVPPHPTNGDEARYANRIGSDSRGLPHNARGEVDPQAWRLATAAFASRDPADFEKIPLGGTRKLLNPVGTLAVSLDGLNASQFALPPAPALASAQRASEATRSTGPRCCATCPSTSSTTERSTATCWPRPPS